MKKVLYHFPEEQLYQSSMRFLQQQAPLRYEYAQKYHQREDRYQCALAYVLVCMAYERSVGELFRGKNGKPYCRSQSGKEYLSIAHTKSLVAVAVSEQEVGLDCEQVDEISLEVIHMVCSAEEQAEIRKTESLIPLFWTAKEALSKLCNEDWYSTPKTNLVYNGKNVMETFHPLVQFDYAAVGQDVLCVASEIDTDTKFENIQSQQILSFLEHFS